MEEKLEKNVLEKIEKKIEALIAKDGIKKENVDYIYKLIDIHKDLKNEDYWKIKEERYNEIRRVWC